MKQLKKTAAKLDDYGRNGDTEVVHVNPREMALLKALGGSGTRNPKTGLREFWDQDPMGSGADYGYGPGTTDASRATAENMANDMVGAMNAAATAPTYAEDAQKAQYTPRSLPQQFSDWVGLGVRDKMRDIRDNPIAAALNLAASFTPVGALNTVSGIVGGPTVGGMTTAAARSLSGYAEAPKSEDMAPVGLSTGSPQVARRDVDPEPRDGGDPNTYNPTQAGPSGSGQSPLATALLGGPPKNRPISYGSLVSSFGPNGRQYVTPWGYRG